MRFPAQEERETYPERCDLCGGTVSEQLVSLALPDRDGRVRIIEGVPAGVCDQCHEQYLTVETRAIDRLLAAPPSRQEAVPVWDFAKAG
ncbi:MAG: YgiT-type zinc finger protein [Actinomycetota bacterium]